MIKTISIFSAVVLVSVISVSSPALASSDASASEVLVQWEGSEEISVLEASDAPAVVEMLQDHPLVQHAEAEVVRTLSVIPNDPNYDDQYYLEQANDSDVDAAAAWDITTGDNSVVIAVIDTGVYLDHEDLVNNIWENTGEIANNGIDDDNNGYIDDVNGWDFWADDNNPNPYDDNDSDGFSSIIHHGTHVAGIAAAQGNNGVGVAGVAWDVQIMPLRVFDQFGDSSTSAIIEAIKYARENGAHVINMSYGGGSSSFFEESAILNAYEDGIISVAAAGNESENLNNSVQFPACYDEVLTVSATDNLDEPPSFTNYGTDCVDIAAPGATILSTKFLSSELGLTEAYGYLSGTSMSTPVVAGVVALMRSINMEVSASNIIALLTQTVDPISDATLGSGRVNAANALEATLDIDIPDAPTVKAFTKSNKKTAIKRNKRTNDSSPFFKWNEPDSVNPIAGYYIYIGEDKVDPSIYGEYTTKLNYQAKGLTGNKVKHRVRVVAVDTKGLVSDVGSFPYLVDTKIEKPHSLTPEFLGDALRITWKQPKKEAVRGYKVYRSSKKKGGYELLHSGRIEEKEFTDTTIELGEKYFYKVKSIDNLNNQSKRSRPLKVTL